MPISTSERPNAKKKLAGIAVVGFFIGGVLGFVAFEVRVHRRPRNSCAVL